MAQHRKQLTAMGNRDVAVKNKSSRKVNRYEVVKGTWKGIVVAGLTLRVAGFYLK